MNRDGRKKTQRVFRFPSNYPLSKFIEDKGLKDLWRTEDPDTSEFTHFDRSAAVSSRRDRTYTDIEIASNTKINHRMVSLTDYFNTISIDRLPSKTKFGKNSWYINNSLLCMPEFSSTTENLLFYQKHEKQALFSKWLVGIEQMLF